MSTPEAFLDSQVSQYPEQTESFNQLKDLYKNRLWHQLALKLKSLSNLSFFQQPGHLLRLHENFVSKCQKQLNPLDYAILSVEVVSSHADPLAFLQAVTQQIEGDEQAKLILGMETAKILIQKGNLEEAKSCLDDAKKVLDSLSGAMDEICQSAYYRTAMDFHKTKNNAADYFSNAILFLTYTPLASIRVVEQRRLAVDLTLAGILGKTIYNFGELLQHPILSTLKGTTDEWLYEFLQSFNQGNINRFHQLFTQHGSSNPGLKSEESFLNQKIRIMALIELVYSRMSRVRGRAAAVHADVLGLPSHNTGDDLMQDEENKEDKVDGLNGAEQVDNRSIPFELLATHCQCPADQVEHLLMKSFSLKVVKGKIDEVLKSVRFTWVQPRTLNLQQIKVLQERVVSWASEVAHTTSYLQKHGAAIL